jgi:hypothetical protein
MTDHVDLETAAKAIVDGNRYMTLATADENGRPWASPVWYAPAGYNEFFWVSLPEARHSHNVAVRSQIGIVIFDSNAPLGTGRGVYLSAVAEEVAGGDLDRGIAIFSKRSEAQGGHTWTHADVQPPAGLRLYRATVQELYVLDAGDRRVLLSVD